MKIDLEEFDFTIDHIAGKNNLAADTLSRITIEDLKTLYENNVTMLKMTQTNSPNYLHIKDFKQTFEEPQILAVQTRSMTRKAQRIPKKVGRTQDFEQIFVPVVEELVSEKDIPTLITNAQFILSARKNKKKIFQMDLNKYVRNDWLDLGTVLSLLEKIATNCSINKFKWPKNDKFFQLISISTFKEMCKEKLTKLQISLTASVQKINTEQEKNDIMKRYHDDPFRGGHCGQIMLEIVKKF